jgi:hypothetical protein
VSCGDAGFLGAGVGCCFLGVERTRGSAGQGMARTRLMASANSCAQGAGQVLRTAGDRHRHIACHRAPIVDDLRSRQRPRQAAGQTGRVGQHARNHIAGVPNHIVAADLNSNVFRPRSCWRPARLP